MLPQPISIDNPPAFHEVLEGDFKPYPASQRELHVANVAAGFPAHSYPALKSYDETPHALTDGEYVYYSVAVDIPPSRKRIGGPKKVNRVVWVRGTFDLGRPATRWEPEEGAEPVNPDGDGVFRSLTDAVIHSALERKARSLSESAWFAESQWDERYVLAPQK